MHTFEHGGNIHKILRDSAAGDNEILDFSANINPLGPPEWFRPLISSQLEHLLHYPDPDNTLFVEAIAEHTTRYRMNAGESSRTPTVHQRDSPKLPASAPMVVSI